MSGSTRPLPDLAARIRDIRRLPRPARLAALRAGLEVASPDEALPLAIELAELATTPSGGFLVERRRAQADDALDALVSLWARLPPDARRLALGVGRGRWEAAIADVLSAPEGVEEARSAALLAGELPEPAVAGSLVTALGVDDDQTRRLAELGLLRLSLRARGAEAVSVTPEIGPEDLGGTGPARIGGAIEGLERAALDVHLADAAWGFAGHQRRLVLLAGLVALDLAGLSASRRDQGGASGSARLLRLVQESSHVSHRALRQILRWSPAPLVRERALLLLSEPAIAEAALERLSRAESVDEHSAVLNLAHLGLRPSRRRLLAMVRVRSAAPAAARAGSAAPGRTEPIGDLPSPLPGAHEAPTVESPQDRTAITPGQILPDPRIQRALGRPARAAVPLLAGLVDADDQARLALLRDALSDEDPGLRLRALALLPRAELAHYCFDEDPHVARSAMLRWSAAGLGLRARAEPGERARVVSLLRRSPHAGVRRLAEEEASRETPWDAWSPASRASAWRLALRERDGLLAHVRRMVRGERANTVPPGTTVGEDQIRGILIARRLGLARVVGMDLAELLEPDGRVEPRVAATAASALGDVDDAVSRAALRRALAHPNARVRANAVEAIGVQRLAVEDATTGRDRDYGSLIELKGDPHHRIRANAIRALLQSPPACPKERRGTRRHASLLESKPRVYEPAAIEALGAMLADDRAPHRLAGVWLAGRVLSGGNARIGGAWSGLSVRLSELAERDTDPLVRARAQGVTRRLSAAIRASWSGQAPEVSDAAASVAVQDSEMYAVEPVEPAGTKG